MTTENAAQTATGDHWLLLGEAKDGFAVDLSIWTCPSDAGALLNVARDGVEMAEVDCPVEIAIENGQVVARWKSEDS